VSGLSDEASANLPVYEEGWHAGVADARSRYANVAYGAAILINNVPGDRDHEQRIGGWNDAVQAVAWLIDGTARAALVVEDVAPDQEEEGT